MISEIWMKDFKSNDLCKHYTTFYGGDQLMNVPSLWPGSFLLWDSSGPPIKKHCQIFWRVERFSGTDKFARGTQKKFLTLWVELSFMPKISIWCKLAEIRCIKTVNTQRTYLLPLWLQSFTLWLCRPHLGLPINKFFTLNLINSFHTSQTVYKSQTFFWLPHPQCYLPLLFITS